MSFMYDFTKMFSFFTITLKRKEKETNRSGISLRYNITLRDRESVIRVSQRERKSNSSMGPNAHQAVRRLHPNLALGRSRASEVSQRAAVMSSASVTVKGKCVVCVSVRHIDSTRIFCTGRPMWTWS